MRIPCACGALSYWQSNLFPRFVVVYTRRALDLSAQLFCNIIRLLIFDNFDRILLVTQYSSITFVRPTISSAVSIFTVLEVFHLCSGSLFFSSIQFEASFNLISGQSKRSRFPLKNCHSGSLDHNETNVMES